MKIYLSSTYEDLKDHRRVVYEALRKAGHQVVAMEDYVARDERPVDKCLTDVAQSDVYVGIFALRYGYVPPQEHDNPHRLSITELEFRAADTNPRIKCLVYVLDSKTPWSPNLIDAVTGDDEAGKRINRIRDELRREKLAPLFDTPYRLASEIQAALSRIEPSLKPRRSHDAAPPRLTWDIDELGSPYPGLMHFTRRYAPVFFGRDSEVQAVLDRLVSPLGRFVMVSGDSGCGKSSLVDAGVLPRLEASGLSDGRPCRSVYVVPSRGKDPFDALMRALQPYAQDAGVDAFDEAAQLRRTPERLPETLQTIARRVPHRGGLVLFLDQMEELFTRTVEKGAVADTDAFLSGLFGAVANGTLWIIATIRSDFLHHCHRHPDLLDLLRRPAHYPLGRIDAFMLRDMIARPAQAAGLRIADSLVRRLAEEAGAETGNLPLLAFVLQRLFDKRQDGTLSEAAYAAFGSRHGGGMKGALADYAAGIEDELRRGAGREAIDALPELFGRLLVINVEGIPTRKRTRANEFSAALQPLIERLVRARLLTKEGEGEAASVTVAHEKLFEAWRALADWIADNEDALRTLSMASVDASQWRARDYNLAYLWHAERLEHLQKVLDSGSHTADERVREFAWPQSRLIEQLERAELKEDQRATIGSLLGELGGRRTGIGLRDGLVEIDWVEDIPGGARVTLEDNAGEQVVEGPFAVARFPVTHAQFQTFIDSPDGFRRSEWWEGLKKQQLHEAAWPEANAPRENVSWYEAVAFSRWLSTELGYTVRLPTEFEWQFAASGGEPGRTYPWGQWASGHCNSVESGLRRTTAVGLYRHGTWPNGPLDMAGGVWEWCLNKFHRPVDATIGSSSDEPRGLRGGSWFNPSGDCRVACRGFSRPGLHAGYVGFRLLRPR